MPRLLCCAYCEFSTALPSEMVGHMVNTGHGVPDEIDLQHLRDDPQVYGEFASMIQQISEIEGPAEAIEMGHRDVTDPDELAELEQVMARLRERLTREQREAHELRELPQMQTYASLLLVVVYQLVVYGVAKGLLTTHRARRELLARAGEAMHDLGTLLQNIEPGPGELPDHLMERVVRMFDAMYDTSLTELWEKLRPRVDRDLLTQLQSETRRAERRTRQPRPRPS